MLVPLTQLSLDGGDLGFYALSSLFDLHLSKEHEMAASVEESLAVDEAPQPVPNPALHSQDSQTASEYVYARSVSLGPQSQDIC